MNTFSRGVRNAFRNIIRTFSIVVILGLSMGLALSMLVANRAVSEKIDAVQESANKVGNMVAISPAGARGFEGGGNALTTDTITKINKASSHIVSVDTELSDRLTSENTNLVSAIEAGNLGRRNANNSGQGFRFQEPPSGNSQRLNTSSGSSTQGTILRTFTPPVTVRGTTAPTSLGTNQGGGTFTLKSGAVFSADSDENVAVLGKTLAEKNNLKVGSTFTAYEKEVKVVAIFDSGNSFSNNQVIMPVKTLQALSDQADQYTNVTAHVDKVENVDSVTTALTKALGTAADVTNEAAAAKENVKTTISSLSSIQTISLYSLLGAVGAGAVIILLTMIMIVRERRREIGVIKAIGASNIKVVGQFMTEAMTLTVLAAVIGVAIGAVAAGPLTSVLVSNSASTAMQESGMGGPGRGGMGAARVLNDIQATVGWGIIGYGLVVALIIAIIGSGLASFFIAKIRPAEVLRSE